MNTVYFETDELGTHKIIDNGKIKVRLLKEPSETYIEKIRIRNEKIDQERIKKEKIDSKEKLIKDKMRELAISELEKEGKL